MTVAIYLIVVVALGLVAAVPKLPPLVGFITAGFVLGTAEAPTLP
ncbi:hypothetical protein [Actinomyces wuliandei]|nr:hypothetical protein [Actinomyces wuliandei]